MQKHGSVGQMFTTILLRSTGILVVLDDEPQTYYLDDVCIYVVVPMCFKPFNLLTNKNVQKF